MRTVFLLSSMLLTTACSRDTALLSSGTYTMNRVELTSGDDVTPSGHVELDMEGLSAVFFDGTGAELAEVAFSLEDEALWPSDCPTQYSMTRMQTATIDADQLDIDVDEETRVVLDLPSLTSNCPHGDEVLVCEGAYVSGGDCLVYGLPD